MVIRVWGLWVVVKVTFLRMRDFSFPRNPANRVSSGLRGVTRVRRIVIFLKMMERLEQRLLLFLR